MSEPECILQTIHASRRFREGILDVPVLEDVDICIHRGMQLAIVGASGSGKSTLLHLLGGLDLPTTGTILLHGRNWSDMRDAERGRMRNRHIGFVYQMHHLLPEFSAVENVAIPLLIRGQTPGAAKREAENWLSKVDLANRLHHKPAELSGGERQRVAIARALVTQPDVILADEPTGNLDRERAEQVFHLLLEMNEQIGSALVVVTHDQRFAARMPHRVRIENGRTVPAATGSAS